MGNPLLFCMFAPLMAWNMTLMAAPMILISAFMPPSLPDKK